MFIASERFASRRDTLAFIVCLLVSVALRVAPVGVQFGVAAGVRASVLKPFLWMQHQTAVLRTAYARTAMINRERDSSAVDVLELVHLREENQRLRDLLELSSRMPAGYVSAEILHQLAPSGVTLLLSAGRNQGVSEMDPVVASGGLLGAVQSVGAETSVILIWTHPDFRASAMTADGAVLGIVAPHGSEGPNVQLLELQGVPFRQQVPIGTRVFTSGMGMRLGGVYPRGIPLGTVTAIADEEEGWSRTYVVRPTVQPASVTHVIVLTGTTDDVSSAFEGDSS